MGILALLGLVRYHLKAQQKVLCCRANLTAILRTGSSWRPRGQRALHSRRAMNTSSMYGKLGFLRVVEV